jgi:hypothetical protein
MSFFKRLFGRPAPDNFEYVKAMAEMAAEAERTYRGMIDIYNEEVSDGILLPPGPLVAPTGRGIYKARLFGALFMVMAYARSTQADSETEDLMNIATGVALEPLQGPDEPRLDREVAESFTVPYLASTVRAMIAAFNAGPLLPAQPRNEHLALAEHLHEALAESIGLESYTAEVRERFAVMVECNTGTAMNHAARWTTA